MEIATDTRDARGAATLPVGAGERTGDRTRDAVARTVLEQGPHSAAALAERLGLSAAAIRRHLDALVGDGILVEREPRPSAQRGRGRPARTYALTDAGRASFPHAYDDLASTALRYLRDTGGEQAVEAFAAHRAEQLADLLTERVDRNAPLATRTGALAGGLTAHGYASTTQAVGSPNQSTNGIQICQHHCPVAHVAAEFPQLCEAETRAFEQVLGTYVQRLATIAHGDGVCTTHVPHRPETPTHPIREDHR
ncbi:helix-turn-helix transcriptional regulator [uncultured Jatrophihabitans sp.]|uniref:helix-turn-helix transcriptional regulator n=1 Tax=uncultured Jatrophihabitans sp. TaxID=1610747 RepID=UPI0035CC8D10